MTTAHLQQTRRTLALADLRAKFALRLASLGGARFLGADQDLAFGASATHPGDQLLEEAKRAPSGARPVFVEIVRLFIVFLATAAGTDATPPVLTVPASTTIEVKINTNVWPAAGAPSLSATDTSRMPAPSPAKPNATRSWSASTAARSRSARS